MIKRLILGIVLMVIFGCKKQPTICDPDGYLDEKPRRTVSMGIHRISDDD